MPISTSAAELYKFIGVKERDLASNSFKEKAPPQTDPTSEPGREQHQLLSLTTSHARPAITSESHVHMLEESGSPAMIKTVAADGDDEDGVDAVLAQFEDLTAAGNEASNSKIGAAAHRGC